MAMNKGRSLTAGEKNLVNRVFNNSFSLGLVRVHDHAYPGSSADRPHSNRNDIYLPVSNEGKSSYVEDFFAMPLGRQAVLIHELVHVWQHQTGRKSTLPTGHVVDYVHELGTSLAEFIKQKQLKTGRREVADVAGAPMNTNPVVTPPQALVTMWTELAGGQTKPVIFPGKDEVRLSKRYADAYKIDEGVLREYWARNADYDYFAHEWQNTAFDRLNSEAQAQMIIDYFILLNGGNPRALAYDLIYTTGKPCPSLAVYKKIIPFVKS